MEQTAMGRVLVTAKIENLADLYEARKGLIPADQVKTVEVCDALVDTGASTLSLPARFVDQLGLKRMRVRRYRTSAGYAESAYCDAVRLTIQGRDCVVDVSEIPDSCPVLVGQVPLEVLDFVIDPKNHKLIGNPEHGGEWMHDIF